MVKRIFVEKRPGFDIEAQQMLAELRDVLGVDSLADVRVLNRYDVEGIDDELFASAVRTVFSEPQSDLVYSTESEVLDSRKDLGDAAARFIVEFLPGQFDQRAESAAECIELISAKTRPTVKSAKEYVLYGAITADQLQEIKGYVVNPVEARLASEELPDTLQMAFEEPSDVEVIDGFIDMDDAGLYALMGKLGLAMDMDDFRFLQDYFKGEGRNPTITEIKVVDTYWSDHCRHTTFSTLLENIRIDDVAVSEAYDLYLDLRHQLGRDDKPLCLMDIATIAARYLRSIGVLTGLDESDEINACTVKVKVDVRGEEQDWLYLFKNETHNHPTEIEPFGGAATCVGGAIRDPLSGRAYVYQAMRLSGSSDPRASLEDTLQGKLPQRKIATTSASGYSSYGNQIGLATGLVHEFYHPGYQAKHMEVGAVVGATPQEDVRREEPTCGDVVVLLGGRTGRDGIGGATGSSKAHSTTSVDTCAAEVQKGNPPVERKIQRLFRNHDACEMIKRCNDFGAGGVSVAIGELADSLDIYLDKVPKKYEGLDGTELAISESQERMAVALDADDVADFIEYAHLENLEATPVAVVSDTGRVRMHWKDKVIVDLSREFLASNGAPKRADVSVADLGDESRDASVAAFDANAKVAARRGIHVNQESSLARSLEELASDVNVASNKGLVERFDSTIGSASVLMPFGGKNQLTPAQAMVAKLPVLGGQTSTVSGLSWGFDPYLSESNPFAGAYMAVVDSIGKLIATGFERKNIYLTFQEYFEKLGDDPYRWGKPFSALLGALSAQLDLECAAIGGKDSMSGSFEDIHVPPTLISFATAIGSIDRIVSPEFKKPNSNLAWLCSDDSSASDLRVLFDSVEHLISTGNVIACSHVGHRGLAETLFKMCVGNSIGVTLSDDISIFELFAPGNSTFVLELAPGVSVKDVRDELYEASDEDSVRIVDLGRTEMAYVFQTATEVVDLADVQRAWEGALHDVYPYKTLEGDAAGEAGDSLDAILAIQDVEGCSNGLISYEGGPFKAHSDGHIAHPRVIIPVFPGTNCEYDTLAAFESAGAKVETLIINNLSPDHVRQSMDLLEKSIRDSQILMFPGGFSGGDEPDGSAKFITAAIRSPQIADAIRELLQKRDGLILGICNGFQALVKSGLVPYGDITEMNDASATLTFNEIGRHQSRLVRTRVASDLSPWLSKCESGEMHTIAISHGEGRFVAPDELLVEMIEKGQIATQYVNEKGLPSMDLADNPNGSVLAIEGISSPDGRVLGKMGHSERAGHGLYKNVPGSLYQPIFEGGVSYFL